MFKDLFKILINPTVLETLIPLTFGGVGYIIAKLSSVSADMRFNRKYELEMQKSQKRSMLRCEYLNIFNSTYLSIEEKYNATRLVYRDYKNLNGNHYIDELDEKLTTKYNEWLEEKRNEKNQLDSSSKK